MGKYIRHGIAALVGAVLGVVVGFLTAQGIVVETGDLTMVEAFLTDGLTMFVTVFGYAFTEKFLKRFPSIDIEGYADRLWLKRETAEPARRI